MANDQRRGNAESRSNEARPRRRGGGCSRGGCGCALPSIVLVIGIILAIFSTNLGIGVSVRVPFTESNLSVAGSVGSKELAIDTLPNYMEQKVADNNNLINQSITLTIWPAEGVSLIVLGKQEGAPVVDIHLDAERR